MRERSAAGKPRLGRAAHPATWICDRNSVRGKTIHLPHVTPAIVVSFQPRAWSVRDRLRCTRGSARDMAQS
jgi:hypothetical protein